MTAPGVPTDEDQADVAIVGGGPAGCAAAVFTARYGLDTVVFDSGPSSLRQCAFLANYLGFPGGVDIETFLALAQAHAREAGATIHQERVDAIDRDDSGDRFGLELHDNTAIEADYVIAATRSGGEYLRPLGGDAMFESHEHDGEVHEHFDPKFADVDGRTPIDGLYVASPAGERDVQAIVAAGQGAHVARRLLADRRRERGYPAGLDEVYDWLRPGSAFAGPGSEFAGDEDERDHWREWFESRLPEGASLDDEIGSDGETLHALREEYVDQVLATRHSPEAVERLTDESVERLVDVIGPDRVLEAIDEERVREYLRDETTGTEVPSDG